MRSKLWPLSLLVAACAFCAQVAHGAVTILIVNNDPAGVGFNDATPVAPVGGNPGTTLGQQRLNAFQSAANKWGATLTSPTFIRIRAQWTALTCTATGAVLGSAGATEVFRDFPGAPIAGAWYPKALTNRLTGADRTRATPDINASFNINLGQPGCLTGVFFYLGLDNNHGTNVDLVTVLTHEFAHGLGFQTFTNGSTGAFLAGFPSVWDPFLFDAADRPDLGRDDQRTARHVGDRRQACVERHPRYVGRAVGARARHARVHRHRTRQRCRQVRRGHRQLRSGARKSRRDGRSHAGVRYRSPHLGLACNPLSAADAAAVNGKIAMVDRGTCTFNIKVANVQAAGAIAAIVVDTVAGSPPSGLGGTDPTITIPSVRITLADGNTLKNFLQFRSRTHSGMFATLGVDNTMRQYADTSNRPFMYTPNPFQGGSSVSHWDVRMFPNQLMEPAINADLTHEVTPNFDLTSSLLQDIGW